MNKNKMALLMMCFLILKQTGGLPVESPNSTFPLLSSNYSQSFFSSLEEKNNETYEIIQMDVDTESDTLMVPQPDPGGGEAEEMIGGGAAEEMIGAEQGRDQDIGRRGAKTPGVIHLDITEDVDEFRKQLNISSETLDSIMEAERGRDETLTDIMFRPLPDVDVPSLARLVANTSDYVELVAAATPHPNISVNLTGHEVADDLAPDTTFNDLQSLLLACAGTLLPLLMLLVIFFLVRCVARRCCPRCRRGSEVSSDSDSDSDKPPLDNEYNPVTSSPPRSGVAAAGGGGGGGGGGGTTRSPPANGSIITMTLKNNHLIVETEESNDIVKNGRETKMTYSPDSDGVFIVEVQQSAPYRPPPTPQQALIHDPPSPVSPSPQRPVSTGLSTSDLSISSAESHAPSYSYCTQGGYQQGPLGYNIDNGYDVPALQADSSQEPLISRTPTDPDRPVVTAAIFKQDSLAGGEPYCLEGSSDGPLLSDVQAREVSLHQLQDRMQRADTLPCDPEPIPELPVEPSTPRGKRASLPSIAADIKVLLSSSSPRFEKLTESVTPEVLDEKARVNTPVITITEELETQVVDDDNS